MKTINGHNGNIQGQEIRVLILYEELFFYIGDNCIKLDKIGLCKHFFNNASVDINFLKPFLEGYEALLENNPNFNTITALPYDEIEFTAYDVIIVISYEEKRLMKYLYGKYEIGPHRDNFFKRIYSASRYITDGESNEEAVFPEHTKLNEYVLVKHKNKLTELHLTDGERAWANSWFTENGLQKGEQVVVMLDSTSNRQKLVQLKTYFSVLEYFLCSAQTKVLIFDEKNAGKADFYKSYLRNDLLFKRIIFSNAQSLRKHICLLGSDHIKVILGPCTGMLHCASSIYNSDVRKGKHPHHVPLMVTYTGKYFSKRNNTAVSWWGNSPLVNCLTIRQTGGRKEMKPLSDCTAEEKINTENLLLCEEYTAGMLIGYIESKLAERTISKPQDT